MTGFWIQWVQKMVPYGKLTMSRQIVKKPTAVLTQMQEILRGLVSFLKMKGSGVI